MSRTAEIIDENKPATVKVLAKIFGVLLVEIQIARLAQVGEGECEEVGTVDVDDLKAATAKAKSLGATVIKENVDVAGHGAFTIITDPTGAFLGLWHQKKA